MAFALGHLDRMSAYAGHASCILPVRKPAWNSQACSSVPLFSGGWFVLSASVIGGALSRSMILSEQRLSLRGGRKEYISEVHNIMYQVWSYQGARSMKESRKQTAFLIWMTALKTVVATPSVTKPPRVSPNKNPC
jgi:hypothetical protein